jgi:hypothetical protein
MTDIVADGWPRGPRRRRLFPRRRVARRRMGVLRGLRGLERRKRRRPTAYDWLGSFGGRGLEGFWGIFFLFFFMVLGEEWIIGATRVSGAPLFVVRSAGLFCLHCHDVFRGRFGAWA